MSGAIVSAHPTVRLLEVVDRLRDRLLVVSHLETVELLTQHVLGIRRVGLLHVVRLLADDVGLDRHDVECDRWVHVRDVVSEIGVDLRAVVIRAGQPFRDPAEILFPRSFCCWRNTEASSAAPISRT